MSGLNSRREPPFKRRWEEKAAPFFFARAATSTSIPSSPSPARAPPKMLKLSGLDDDIASTVVPPVTVAIEGRSICHRIHLHKHAGYESLAVALRRMFVDPEADDSLDGLDLSNAVPGYLVAYEDMEDDLLLAGDLKWKDFVRVAKRIRIIPAKAARRKHC